MTVTDRRVAAGRICQSARLSRARGHERMFRAAVVFVCAPLALHAAVVAHALVARRSRFDYAWAREHRAVVKGDNKSHSIACASIVAA